MPQAAQTRSAGRRPEPCRARWRHSSPRPPPPQRAEGLRLGLQQFRPAWTTLQIRFMALSSSACTGSKPLRCLSEASIPPESLSHATARAGRSLRPTGATEVAHGSSRKSRRTTSRLRATVHRWNQVPAGLPAKPGLGKTWTSQARPHLPTGPSTSNSRALKIIGHVPILLGHFD